MKGGMGSIPLCSGFWSDIILGPSERGEVVHFQCLNVRNFMPAQQYSLIYIWPEITTERPALYWVKYGILSTKPGMFDTKERWNYGTIWQELLTSHGIRMSLLNHGNFKNLKEVILRSLKGCHLVKGQLLPMEKNRLWSGVLTSLLWYLSGSRTNTDDLSHIIILTCYTAQIIRQ